MKPQNAQPWEEVNIVDWRHFISITQRVFEAYRDSEFMFRGQSQSAWGLRPALMRHLFDHETEAEAIAIEKQALHEFKQQAHLYSEIPPQVLANRHLWAPAWWALMQHYNAPTRLLDWTGSPFVAMYFAVEKDQACEGAVWYFDWSKFAVRPECIHADSFTVVQELRKDRNAAKKIGRVPLAELTERMIAQQGQHTFCTNVYGDHGQIIGDSLGNALNKLIVRGELKGEFLLRLRSMNITASSLFPGLDGFGRSVAELVHVHTHRTRALRRESAEIGMVTRGTLSAEGGRPLE